MTEEAAATDGVTVIIPCFNDEDVLERALRSVLAQDVPGVRIIVVDDASTDGSAVVAERWASDHVAITAIRQLENQGAAAARNHGLELATGAYVCFLDSDDELLDGFLDRTLDVLEHSAHVASVSTGVDFVGASLDLDPTRYAALVNSGPSNVVVRRAIAQLIGGFPEASTFRGESAGEDIVFRTILTECFSQVHLNDKLLRYHVKEGSHLERFLERTAGDDQGLTFERLTKEESNGAIDREGGAFLQSFAERIRGAASSNLAVGALSYLQVLSVGAAEIEAFRLAQESMAEVPGTVEDYVLHVCAAFGPGTGAIVDLGADGGSATGWLTSGAKRANREGVLSRPLTGHFGPVRLLSVACAIVLEGAFEDCLPHIVIGGLVVLHGVGEKHGSDAFDTILGSHTGSWRRVISLQSLRVFEKIAP
jgi:hypothetical protein